MNDILDILIPVLPAVVVGILAYYFFDGFLKNEENRRRFILHKEAQTEALPIRLQAYERLTLFLERISPLQLLIRVKPNGEDKKAYVDLLAATIEQEFEHNLTQQVYVSNECWAAIKSAKNTLIQQLRKTLADTQLQNAQDIREYILTNFDESQNPTSLALDYLKAEVQELFG